MFNEKVSKLIGRETHFFFICLSLYRAIALTVMETMKPTTHAKMRTAHFTEFEKSFTTLK